MVTLSNINKSFGELHILKNIDIEFQEGKTTVLIGSSGSGKSTLLRCINLLEQPETGNLEIDGKKINFEEKIRPKDILEIRKKTGMVFQGFHLFPHLTVLENIIEGPVYVLKQTREEAKKTAIKLLKQVGLLDKIDNYPEQLSGGQQQRISIARAMAMNPKFLLFDEPTSALDPELEAEVLKVLKELSNNGNSMLIVTHNLNFAREVADEIIFLEKGKIEFKATPNEVFNKCENERVREFVSTILKY